MHQTSHVGPFVLTGHRHCDAADHTKASHLAPQPTSSPSKTDPPADKATPNSVGRGEFDRGDLVRVEQCGEQSVAGGVLAAVVDGVVHDSDQHRLLTACCCGRGTTQVGQPGTVPKVFHM